MEPKRTPLYQRHVESGARMVEFAGYLMPMQFTGIIDEHLSVRRNVGIFDVTHMGEISVSGPRALEFVNRLTTNDVASLDVCMAQYSTMLNRNGGVIDDLIVYRRKYDYLLVVNAANIKKDFEWIKDNCPADVKVEDLSETTGEIAVQGPNAVELMMKAFDGNFADLGRFRAMGSEIAGAGCLISRTGYTGEDGFEIYMNASDTVKVWDILTSLEPKPALCGLGARDTLRLEAGMRLYGKDMDETTTPLEAGLGWVVSFDKGDFIGKEALLRQKAEGSPKRLIGLVTSGKRFPRSGFRVFVDGQDVGYVTSGGYSPMLDCGIAFAYVSGEYASGNHYYEIDIRGQRVSASFVKGAFYKKRT
ncbi:MAG: glycine cleavage system aminomethyltransferase GcvT [bacterium]